MNTNVLWSGPLEKVVLGMVHACLGILQEVQVQLCPNKEVGYCVLYWTLVFKPKHKHGCTRKMLKWERRESRWDGAYWHHQSLKKSRHGKNCTPLSTCKWFLLLCVSIGCLGNNRAPAWYETLVPIVKTTIIAISSAECKLIMVWAFFEQLFPKDLRKFKYRAQSSLSWWIIKMNNQPLEELFSCKLIFCMYWLSLKTQAICVGVIFYNKYMKQNLNNDMTNQCLSDTISDKVSNRPQLSQNLARNVQDA